MTDDLEKKEHERLNMFFKFVEVQLCVFGISYSIWLCSQDIKQKGGVAAVAGSFNKIKGEAERLEVMDKAAGILAELLYTEKLLTQIKEYRPIMVPVSANGFYK